MEKLIELYIDIFLLYLICRFAIDNKDAMTKDAILGRKVPSIVFLQNRKLLKEAMMDSFSMDEVKR